MTSEAKSDWLVELMTLAKSELAKLEALVELSCMQSIQRFSPYVCAAREAPLPANALCGWHRRHGSVFPENRAVR